MPGRRRHVTLARVIAAPDYFEPVIGWRVWNAVERHGELELTSVFHKTRWPRNEPFTAACEVWRPPWRRRGPSHDAPDDSCPCGIYAASLETAIRYIAPRPPRARWPVVGHVLLWGVVVECTDGWRASRAYPDRLYVPTMTRRGWGHACRVAAGLEPYGVPVEVIDAASQDEIVERLSASGRPARRIGLSSS
jgi:hypothetical protein